jgi:bla regulator protein blaR1
MIDAAVLQSPWVEALGWALLHSLWQALVLALLYGALRHALSARSAALRVALGELTLLMCLLLPAITVWRQLATTASAAPLATAGELPWLGAPMAAVVQTPSVMGNIVAAWAIGVALLALRAAWRWQRLRGVVQRAQPLESAWQQRFTALCAEAGLRVTVRWLESAEVAGPVLVGWMRPVILFPLGMTVGIPPRQIELLLAHELAHVRRADFLFNLFQLLVETLLFFNPAVHWISAQVRHERELACDDRVAQHADDRTAYARALLAVAEHRHAHGSLALAATGGVLMQRIQRIVGEVDERDPRGGGLRSLLVVALLLMLLVAGLRSLQTRLTAIELPVRQWLENSLRTVGTEPLQLAPFAPPRMEPLRPAVLFDESLSDVEAAVVPPAIALPGLDRAVAVDAALQIAPPGLALERPVLPASISVPPTRSEEARVGPLRSTAPDYPVTARIAGIEGWVDIGFRVGADGTVHAMRVIEAQPAGVFDAAARDAMSRWQFPASAAGEQRVQRFDFTLTGGEDPVEGSKNCQRPATGSRVCRRTPPLGD